MNTTTKMHHQLAAVTADRDHWKANHDNRVNAAKILMDRTDMPLERIGAYKQYMAALEANQKLRERAESAEAELLAVREDNHSMMLEIAGLRTERDRLAQQKPVATLILSNYGSDFEMFYDLKDLKFDGMKMRLYAAPVPALAMPTDEQIHAAYRTALGQSIRERDMPEIRKFANELLRAAPVVAAPAGFIPTPFLPDDDTRRNDAEFAAQQAAPSVPEEWRAAIQEAHDTFQRYADLHRAKDTPDGHKKAKANQKLANKLYALLQSSDHSAEVKK